jgi:hypothetical protein
MLERPLRHHRSDIAMRGIVDTSCEITDCWEPCRVLCDYPVLRHGKVATCDVRLCRRHARRTGANTDYCPEHTKHG